MQLPQPPRTDTALCPICRARLNPALPFCAVCGAQLNDARTREEEELRGVLYLLSELERWEASGQIEVERARHLRSIYTRRRDDLRRSLSTVESENLSQSAPAPKAERPPEPTPEQAHAEQSKRAPVPERQVYAQRESQYVAFPARSTTSHAAAPTVQGPQRTLLERLADPRTLRLLLYTGAAMLVVGVVIWLRDLLYLKLQEPVVQAGLLALATTAFTISGWYTILRTRQRWTGRALTLVGSLLVPVNFWFLVRSGLLENQGRAWVVCAICALLYAYTALLLRERLYVYLASVAAVATPWTLILRDAPEAYGLYALTLMAASLIFLHLSRLFPTGAEPEVESEKGLGNPKINRWSRELWSTPLVRTALFFSALSALFYMPLRFIANGPSFYSGIFRVLSSSYDASLALLILAAGAYVLWFAGRYVNTRLRAPLYSISVLLFFLMVWVTCDGFRLGAEAQVLFLTLATFIVALFARMMRSDALLAQAFHHSSLMASILLAIASISVLLSGQAVSAMESASLALVAASFALLSAPRFNSPVSQAALAHFAALYFSLSYFAALASTSLQSETLITLLCAAWPLALYGAAELTIASKRETQLSNPFTRTADAFTLLLLLWGGLLALLIHLTSGGASRSSSIIALAGVVIYGALRSARSRSVYAMMLCTLAAVIMTAGVLDAAKKYGLWPATWPIAAGVLVFIFLLERGCVRLLRSRDEMEKSRAQPLMTAIHMVLDLAVGVCSVLWLVTGLVHIETGGFGAPSVLLLALMYWVERAVETRTPWPVRVTAAHMGAFLITLLIALSVDPVWLDLLFVLTIFPTFFILSRYARRVGWLSAPLSEAAVVALALSLLLALIQAGPHLEAGDEYLLAPALTASAVALLCFAASIFSRDRASVLYFRAGLWVAVVSLMLASLRAGFDPLEDAEVYSTPIAVLLLVIAYLSHRRAWADYDRDVGALLWVGSVLLCAPLLARSMQFRLLLDTAAPWRDLSVLIASLALILYGVVGRMRAPVLVGSVALLIELAVLTLTTVDWLQVPLKYYLITVGALLLIVFGTLEYRREQFLAMRKRFQERRDSAREQFGGWR